MTENLKPEEVVKPEIQPKKTVTLTQEELDKLVKEKVEAAKKEISVPKSNSVAKLKEPVLFISNKIGLKIIIDPQHYERTKAGGLAVIQGKAIQFVEGRFYAQTEEELYIMRDYANRNSGVYEMTKKDFEYLEMKAQMSGYEGEKQEALNIISPSNNKGRQGAVG